MAEPAAVRGEDRLAPLEKNGPSDENSRDVLAWRTTAAGGTFFQKSLADNDPGELSLHTWRSGAPTNRDAGKQKTAKSGAPAAIGLDGAARGISSGKVRARRRARST
jgi:hypothetical protein